MKRLMVLTAVTLVAFAVGFVGSRASATPPETCSGVVVNDNRATDFADFLTGTDVSDVASLGTGDDQYFAFTDADTICGDEGADVLGGEGGADELQGGADDDLIGGLLGDDFLNGNSGSDEVRGGKGGDFIRAGLDDVRDDLYDGTGGDTIVGSDEDVWHKCDDDTPDDHDAFSGLTIPDPDC